MLRACVKIMQSSRSTDANLQALLPRERGIIGVVEMVAEVATCHKFVDKYHFPVIVAVANERNKIDVAEL